MKTLKRTLKTVAALTLSTLILSGVGVVFVATTSTALTPVVAVAVAAAVVAFASNLG